MTPRIDLSELGSVPPTELVESRLALHDAAQASAAAAYALLPTEPDHSHSNLLWSSVRGGFVGRALPAGSRCALDPLTLRTAVLGPDGATRGGVSAVGRTLEQVYGELAAVLRRAGESVPSKGLATPDYDLPDTPVRRGERFGEPSRAALVELARWFALGHAAVARVAERQLAGAEVRVWPHHFDLAALRTLDAGVDAETARSLGVGLSPGDDSYAEPYVYVSPWPAPEPEALPRLPRGARWHTEGFTSAVITASDLLELGRNRLDERLDTIVDACLDLLSRPGSK
jgi:hypothetical protein